MANKKVVIIGAGVSGLTAGIYAMQHGLDAIVVEKNNCVGGLCTSWDRKGYTIDGCIHWLTGTKENTLLNEMWENVGAFKGQDDLIYLPSWGHFDYQGTIVTLWRDIDKAEREWNEISPEDKKMTHKFFNMVRDFCSIELPLDLPMSMMPFPRILKLGFEVLSVWPSYLKTMFMSCESFARKFKSPALRFALTNAQPGPGNLFSMLYSYSTVVKGDGGIPVGGSRPMVERMRDKFLSLNGKLLLNSPVNNVLINGKKAVGVALKSGEKIYADYVVSCCDANYTLNRLLLGQYPLKKIDKRIANGNKYPTPTGCLLSFSCNLNKNIPAPFSFECEPFKLGNETLSHITIRNFAFDDSFTRGNRSVVTILVDQLNTDYDFYKNLRKSPSEYRKFKLQLANIVKSRVIKRFPNFGKSFELLDVATPLTLTRYTNATKGAYMTFLFSHNNGTYDHNGFVPGLRNFYLAGQWMQGPGGLPIAMSQGKFAIQKICKKEKLQYVFTPKQTLKKYFSKKI